ncbi:Smr/MutS family protein [Pseudemcibacter aquimaris]|uniref:Smr/MutS family protein n=1 Tax=Pseudemcibacter aquimaris TaxID=2857064 RepID=UPI00201118CE|nr:Smr/MutS family protein [Pseudemcibacter aquimaris]MCC3861819.1 Smr/MutS family protein [Pseudemcibacter aquimaris]WDU58574.1 Smr/MutS family protein [Pseudemcibacter aquimaris]
MARRDLTDEEKHLWKVYTKDVKRLSDRVKIPTPTDQGKRFEIKIPKKKVKLDQKVSTLSNHESLHEKDSNWSKKLKNKRAKPEGKIDLHGMTCAQAHEKLYHFLERSQRNGKRVVLVVTGKGGVKKDYDAYRFSDFENSHGVLKREVPMWLSGGSMRHMVVSFQDALASDGGTGALYVVLKRIS